MAENIVESAIPCDVTKCECFNFKFQWKMEDFMNIPCKYGELFRSKDFGGPTSQSGVKWKINAQMYPRGCDIESKEHLSVYLIIKVEPPKAAMRISATCSFSIMSGDEKKKISKLTKETENCDQGWNWGFPGFVKLKDLEERHQELLPNGDLTIQFEGKTRVLMVSACEKIASAPKPTEDSEVTVEIVNKLFLDGAGSDVVLKARNGEFKGHKWVLSFRCEYFRAMFDSGVKESEEGMVDFSKDMNLEELTDLMEYLYLGMTTNLSKTCRALLKMAEMLGLHELKSESEEILIEQLEEDNAWEMLTLGHKQGAKNLEKKAHLLLSKCMD